MCDRSGDNSFGSVINCLRKRGLILYTIKRNKNYSASRGEKKIDEKYIITLLSVVGVGGIVVSIAAFQAVDPGSIHGRRNALLLLFFFLHY